ncbi:MAG: hypothetical protein ABNH42_18420 [Marinobacter sp.]|jgi:hypothetical protein
MSEKFLYEHDLVCDDECDRIGICELFQKYKGSTPFRFYCRIKLRCASDTSESNEAIDKFFSGINREFTRLGLPEITALTLTNRGKENENATVYFMIGRAEGMEEVSHPLLYMIISNSLSSIDIEDLLLHELGGNIYLERAYSPEFVFS